VGAPFRLSRCSARGGDDEAVPVTAAVATPTSTPAPSPTPAALPALPADCVLIASYHVGERVPRAGEDASIEVDAQPCATTAWQQVRLDELNGSITWELEAPDGPRQLRVGLLAERTPEGLRWTGSAAYPEAGLWTAQFEVGNASMELAPSEVLSSLDLVSGGAGLPLPALPQQVAVLHIDRPDEPVRWDAAGGSLAWIPGRVPGEPARTVWLQARSGEVWAVAGDPTTAVVTALFEVAGDASLIGAPDGRGFVVIDYPAVAQSRVRVYGAERESLIEVPLDEADPPDISWAPDSSVILIAGRQLHLLQSDGAPIKVFDQPSTSAQVEWSPDSKWALVTLREGSSSRVVKVDINVSTATTLFEYGAVIVQSGWENLALSPDGAWIALGWLNADDRTMRLAVLPSGEPFPAVLADHSVVSYQLPLEQQAIYDWLHRVVWSPDGTQLVFALGPTDVVPPGGNAASNLQILDVQAGTVRELARPAQGFYTSGPLWWSTDGSTVFKQWFGCIACDGAGSGIDVIEVESGQLVRTLPQAGYLGTLDGVRHLISTADGLLAVRGLEEPRVLLPGSSLSNYYSVKPSPDANRLAVIESPGREQTVFAVAPDGSSQDRLGAVALTQQIEGLRDAGRVLTHNPEGQRGWSSLLDGSVLPLPGAEGAAPGAPQPVAAISSDGAHLAYWAGTATPGELQLFVGDTGSGEAQALEVFTQQSKGMRLAVSPAGDAVAYLEDQQLVTVDVASEQMQRFALADMGYEPPSTPHSLPFEWGNDGAVQILVGEKLWRAEPASGGVSEVTSAAPTPGGWSGEVELSRSPDGAHLVALTVFGLFELEAHAGWRQITGAGLERGAVLPTRLVWSADSVQVAYVAGGGVGIVVASLDRSEAYELVTAPTAGRMVRVLGWLADGRLVYSVQAQGI
jgi:hypothetical protein